MATVEQLEGFQREMAAHSERISKLVGRYDVSSGGATASTTYVDLGDPGPELTLIPAGDYAVMWGARIFANTAGQEGYANLSLNGSTPADTGQQLSLLGAKGTVSKLVPLTFSGVTSVKVQYRSIDGSSVTFDSCWLAVFAASLTA